GDGRRDHRGGVERIHHIHAFGQKRLQAANGVAHRLGGGQGVGAGGQVDGDAGGRHAVVLGGDILAHGTHFNAGHIAQAYLGTVAVDLEQDLAKFLRAFQTRLADDGGGQLLTGYRRQATELAGGYLHVL